MPAALNPNDPLPPLAAIGAPVGADNLGGLEEIYLLPQAALLSQPVRRGPSIVGDLQLAAGAVWYPLRAVLDTAGFDQSFQQDRQQGLYAGSLTGEVATDSPELAEALLLYRNVRLVVLYRDRNGRLKLAGDTTSWYQLSYKQSTQAATGSGRPGYALELSGRSLRPALFYGGQVPLLPGVPAVGTGQEVGSGAPVQIFNARGKLLATARPGQRVLITSAFRVTIKTQ